MKGFEVPESSIFSRVGLADAARMSPEEHRRVGLLMMREMFDEMVPVTSLRASELFEIIAHGLLKYTPSDGARKRMAEAITIIRSERNYPPLTPEVSAWCEEFSQQALREHPLRALDREREKDSPQRRTKADQKAEAEAIDSLMAHKGEVTAATAWEGFLSVGRGYVMCDGTNAAYVPAAEAWRLPSLVRRRVQRLTREYDPTKEIVLLLVLTEGDQQYLALGKRTPALSPEECLLKWIGREECRPMKAAERLLERVSPSGHLFYRT
jgi:hypothetical protein